MKHHYIFGLGSGRCGTMSLALLLDRQPGAFVTHEAKLLPWEADRETAAVLLKSIAIRTENVVGDVGFYWLNYLDYLAGRLKSVRCIILQREMNETVASFMRQTQAHNRNHWSTSKKNYTVDPRADRAFPKFDCDKEEALRNYWGLYYDRARVAAKRHPEKVRLFDMATVLNDPGAQHEMLRWAGIEDPRVNPGIHVNRPRRCIVIIGIRLGCEEETRQRNYLACLRALNDQTVPRERYEIVVIEESAKAEVERLAPELFDLYAHVGTDQPYSRSRAFNEGVKAATPRAEDLLCFMDADLLVERDFIWRMFAYLGGNQQQAVLPYGRVCYLSPRGTERAIRERFGSLPFNPLGYETANVSIQSVGGCMWITAGLFQIIGGYCEDYIGWGCEDTDFWFRLEEQVEIGKVENRVLVHMDHPKADCAGPAYQRNRTLFEERWSDRIALRKSIWKNATPMVNH